MVLSYRLSSFKILFGYTGTILPKRKRSCIQDVFIVLFLILMTNVNGTSKFECSVCLEYSSDCSNIFCNYIWYNGDQKYVLPCGHSFHLDCITLWIRQLHRLQEEEEEVRREITCPNCRYNILNDVNTELKQLKHKPRIQKFAEKVKLGVKEYIFPTITNMVKLLFRFLWYILENVGKMRPVLLISVFLQAQSLLKSLLYKVGQTRLWTWIRKKGSNSKRKISNLLDQLYVFITGFPNLMWDIYILGPINLVQQKNLEHKPDKTMKIYTYKITAPTLKAYKHETILNEVEQPNNPVHVLNKGDLLYSCIDFSKYKNKEPKLMKIFTEVAGMRDRNFFYIHSRHSIGLEKVQSLRKNMIVTCDIEGDLCIADQIYAAGWQPFTKYDFEIYHSIVFFGLFLLFNPMSIGATTATKLLMIYYMLLAPYWPVGPAYAIMAWGSHLERYIHLVSLNTFNSYYNPDDMTKIQYKKKILELLENLKKK